MSGSTTNLELEEHRFVLHQAIHRRTPAATHSNLLLTHLDQVRAMLDDGDEAGAARKLFEFRCADVAMGSGHFLVAAIDHIESSFSRFLTEHPIGHVNAEL